MVAARVILPTLLLSLLAAGCTGERESVPSSVETDPHAGHDHASDDHGEAALPPPVPGRVPPPRLGAGAGDPQQMPPRGPGPDATEEQIRALVARLNEPIPEGGSGVPAEELTEIGHKAGPFVEEALGSAAPLVRLQALQTLGNMGYVKAVPRIAQVLREDPEHAVRISAAQALGALRTKEALDALVEQAFMEDDHIRFFVLNSIGKHEDPSAIAVLAQIAREDDHPMTRRSAIYAMGFIKDPAALEHLIPLRKDTDKEIRLEVIQAMGTIGGKEIRPYMIEALDDIYDRTRRAAILGMNTIGGRDLIDHIVKLLERERSVFVRQMAAWTIGQLGAKEDIPALKPLIFGEDLREMEAALSATHNLMGEPPVAKVLPLLEDEDPHLRIYAVWVIGVYGPGDPENAVHLSKLWDDENDRVRFEVATMMGRFCHECLITTWAQMLPKETDLSTVGKALYFSQRYVAKQTFYDDGKETPRSREARRMLYYPADRQLIPVYIEMMDHEDVEIRGTVGRVLDTATGVDFGYRFDANEELRRAAQEKARAWWEERKAIDPDEWMRRSVEEAIGKLSTDDPVERQIYADALRQLTGRPYRLSLDSSPMDVQAVIAKWNRWWEENGSKRRIEWLIESIDLDGRSMQENLGVCFEILSYYYLETFGVNPRATGEENRKSIRRLLDRFNEEEKERTEGEGGGQ